MQGLFSETPVEDIYSKLDTEFLSNAVGGRNSRAAAIGNMVNRGLGMVGSAFGMEDSRVQKAKDKQAAIAEAKEKATPGDMGSMYSELAKAFASRGLMNEAAQAGEAARRLGREDAAEGRAVNQDRRAQAQLEIQQGAARRDEERFTNDKSLWDLERRLKTMSVEEKQTTLSTLKISLEQLQKRQRMGLLDKEDALKIQEQEARIKQAIASAEASLMNARTNAGQLAETRRHNLASEGMRAAELKDQQKRAEKEGFRVKELTDVDGKLVGIVATNNNVPAGVLPKMYVSNASTGWVLTEVTEQNKDTIKMDQSGPPPVPGLDITGLNAYINSFDKGKK